MARSDEGARPSADSDSLQLQPLLILPGAGLEIDVDPALWTASGTGQRVTRSGMREIDLGEGRVRREYPDGRKTIDGTKRLGQPVHRVLRPDGEESWQIDYPAVMKNLYTDLNGVDRGGASSVDELPGGRGRILHYPAGAAGSEYTCLQIEGRGSFPVVSDGPLSRSVLQNMAGAIAQAPPEAFEPCKLVFVLGELGDTRDAGKRLLGTVAGFALYSAQALFFTRERLESADSAQETMWHEAGHLFDHVHGKASQTLLDGSQVPVFGYGKLIMEGERVAVDESDFITRYASTSEQEDFAENHRAVLELRERYEASHPGADLLTLPSSDVEGVLKDAGYSEGIRRRMGSIVRIYQDDAAKG